MFFNPYIAGNPIGGQNGFFGRQDIFREVMQVLRHPKSNAVVLYGQRRIGKTSVLLQLERQLGAGGDFTPVYFDLQDKAGKPLGAVLYELAQRIAVVVGQEMPKKVLFDAEGRYFQHTFLPQAANRATKGGLVLLFDEFDVLDSPKQVAGNTFFPYLRSWMSKIKGGQFVFVIGRRPEDLSINTISTLKRIRATRVSLLDQAITLEVVRQSEQEGTLSWPDSAANRLWQWTQGHPYLTQLLCSVIWENAYEDEEDDAPQLTSDDVDQALDKALEQGANAFYWIWDGLPPAERVVMAAMAETSDEVITDEKLVEILKRSGVRLIVRQLELAPETLVEWDLLRPVENGYQFTVPLLRHWVSRKRPLRRVKEELDHVEPAAESLFQSGQYYYRTKLVKDAEDQLRRALQLNPNHLKAQLLLGQLLLEDGRISESVQVLKETYLYDAEAARADLIRALLASADNESQEQQLVIYQRILTIEPNQPVAKARQEVIQEIQRKCELEAKLKIAQQHEAKEKWQEAIAVYQSVLQEFPDEKASQTRLEHAQTQATLAQWYNEALGALETGNAIAAQQLLVKVIAEEPTYKEAARHLLRAVETTVKGPQTKVQKLEKQGKALVQLSAWNPLDHLRLLWWLFMARQTLKAYQDQDEEESVHSVGNWLASTLIWLPLFIPALALGIGTLSSDVAAFAPRTYLWTSGGLVFLWLLTGRFGGREDDSKEFVALGVALGVVGIVTGKVALVVALVVALLVALVVAGGVMGGVPREKRFAEGGVAKAVSEGVVRGVVKGVRLILVVMFAVIFAVMFTVMFTVTGVMELVVAFVMAFIVESVVGPRVALIVAPRVGFVVADSIKSEPASWLSRLVFAILLLDYAFLIWYAFLGGAEILQSSGG